MCPINSTVWVVLENQQDPVRLYHSYAVYLKSHPSFYHSSLSMDRWAAGPEASTPIHISQQISLGLHGPVIQLSCSGLLQHDSESLIPCWIVNISFVKIASPCLSSSSAMLQSQSDEDVMPNRLPTYSQGRGITAGTETRSLQVLDENCGPIHKMLKTFCRHEKIKSSIDHVPIDFIFL